MSDIEIEITERYVNEVNAYIEHHTQQFLKKNLIPYTDIEQAQQLLRDRGMRLHDEVKTNTAGDETHTLMLLQIVDATEFIIKAPKIEVKS